MTWDEFGILDFWIILDEPHGAISCSSLVAFKFLSPKLLQLLGRILNCNAMMLHT